MRWVKKTGVKLTDPVEQLDFFDWIPESEKLVEKR